MIAVSHVLALALQMHDAKGYSKPMPVTMAQAIADASEASPLFNDARFTAAVLVVFAFRESSYSDMARGDGGRSCGAFQTPCAITPLGNPKRQAIIALDVMRRSILNCPESPLAIYASGSCSNVQGRRISSARLELARELSTDDGGGS